MRKRDLYFSLACFLTGTAL